LLNRKEALAEPALSSLRAREEGKEGRKTREERKKRDGRFYK
jgi:hypothetical protein